MRTKWFKTLGENYHIRARTVFKAVVEKYSENSKTSKPVPPEPVVSLRRESSDADLLQSIAMIGNIEGNEDEHRKKNEFERYCDIDDGSKSSRDEPLLWWKVCNNTECLPVPIY